MPFLDLATSKVPELNAVPAGEYELELTSWGQIREGVTGDGRTWACVDSFHKVVGHPNAKTVRFTLWLPVPGDDQEQMDRKLRAHKYFRIAHRLPEDGPLDPDKVGQRAFAMLGLDNDETYGESNVVKRWVSPR